MDNILGMKSTKESFSVFSSKFKTSTVGPEIFNKQIGVTLILPLIPSPLVLLISVFKFRKEILTRYTGIKNKFSVISSFVPKTTFPSNIFEIKSKLSTILPQFQCDRCETNNQFDTNRPKRLFFSSTAHTMALPIPYRNTSDL